MHFGSFLYTVNFYLGFSVVHHFGSERSSLFGLCDFSGIQPSPYSVANNTSFGSGKSEHHLLAYIDEIIRIQVSVIVSDLLVFCMYVFTFIVIPCGIHTFPCGSLFAGTTFTHLLLYLYLPCFLPPLIVRLAVRLT